MSPGAGCKQSGVSWLIQLTTCRQSLGLPQHHPIGRAHPLPSPVCGGFTAQLGLLRMTLPGT